AHAGLLNDGNVRIAVPCLRIVSVIIGKNRALIDQSCIPRPQAGVKTISNTDDKPGMEVEPMLALEVRVHSWKWRRHYSLDPKAYFATAYRCVGVATNNIPSATIGDE